jgi:hypothetical protein
MPSHRWRLLPTVVSWANRFAVRCRPWHFPGENGGTATSQAGDGFGSNPITLAIRPRTIANVWMGPVAAETTFQRY